MVVNDKKVLFEMPRLCPASAEGLAVFQQMPAPCARPNTSSLGTTHVQAGLVWTWGSGSKVSQHFGNILSCVSGTRDHFFSLSFFDWLQGLPRFWLAGNFGHFFQFKWNLSNQSMKMKCLMIKKCSAPEGGTDLWLKN